MLSFGVTIPATVQQGSEIPEGLMNNLVEEWKRRKFLLCPEERVSNFIRNFDTFIKSATSPYRRRPPFLFCHSSKYLTWENKNLLKCFLNSSVLLASSYGWYGNKLNVMLPLCFTILLYGLLYRHSTLSMSNRLRVNDVTVLSEVCDETLKTVEHMVYTTKTTCTLCGIRGGWRNSWVWRTRYYIVHQVAVQ
jgi:hypothetical protein